MATKKHALRIAKRLDEVGFSDIVQIRNKVMELRESGETVHAFHGGEPFFPTPDNVKYAMIRALVEDRTLYAPVLGDSAAAAGALAQTAGEEPSEVRRRRGGDHQRRGACAVRGIPDGARSGRRRANVFPLLDADSRHDYGGTGEAIAGADGQCATAMA